MAPYVIRCTHVPSDETAPAMWVAVSDALGLATEAETYEALVDRVWEIAPDLAEMNGLATDDGRLLLRFVSDMDAPGRYVAA